MSSLILPLAGGAIGAAIPGVGFAVGWAAGSLLGSLTASGQNVDGPRPGALRSISANYGKDRPLVAGCVRYPGTVIWNADPEIIAVEEEQGGKGGPSNTVTTYERYLTFAVGFGSHLAPDLDIVGFRKIWLNGKLKYNAGDDADIETIIASNRAAKEIDFYTGAFDQDPDPDIQADQGVANTQRYADEAYIKFKRLPLKEYGNQFPNVEAEVVAVGGTVGPRKLAGGTTSVELATYPVVFYADETVRVGDAADLTKLAVNVFDVNGISQGEDGLSEVDRWPAYLTAGLSENDKLSPAGYLNGVTVHIRNHQSPIENQDTIVLGAHYDNEAETYVWNGTLDELIPDNIYIYTALCSGDGKKLLITGNLTNIGGPTHYYVIGDGLEDSGSVEDGAFSSTIGVIGRTSYTKDRDVQACGFFEDDYKHVWTCEGNNLSILRIEDGILSSVTDLNPEFGVTARRSIYVKDGVAWVFAKATVSPYQSFYAVFTRKQGLSAGTTTLASITSAICRRAGYAAPDFNVSALTDEISGVLYGQNMTARAMLDPLRQAYFFDMVQLNGVDTFVKRGGAAIDTIEADELGAGVGSISEPLRHTIQQDPELPSTVVVNFLDIENDYQEGSKRFTFQDAVVTNVVTVNLTIAMTGTQAAQIAETLCINAWEERDKFSISLLNTHLSKNVTDVINIPVGNYTRKARIDRASYGSVMTLELVADSAEYTSQAVAADTSGNAQTVGLKGPTKAAYLDAPLLRNSDNYAGLYVGVHGYYDAWPGTQIFKSLDEGGSYAAIEAITQKATIGVATTVLADADPYEWDYSSTLRVKMSNGSLYSITKDDAIKGLNPILVGGEVLHFVNATDLGDDEYELDTFIRARRGTEWATSTHVAGETVVLLSETTLRRFEAVLNVERHYKAVTLGYNLPETTSQIITNTGVNLKPFRPVLITGSRDGTNNLTAGWQWQSRYIGAPLSSLPLFEDTESGEVDVLDGPGGAVLNTYPVSTDSFFYSDDDQIADGLTPGNPVTLKIYQISATVGRGYGTEVTL